MAGKCKWVATCQTQLKLEHEDRTVNFCYYYKLTTSQLRGSAEIKGLWWIAIPLKAVLSLIPRIPFHCFFHYWDVWKTKFYYSAPVEKPQMILVPKMLFEEANWLFLDEKRNVYKETTKKLQLPFEKASSGTTWITENLHRDSQIILTFCILMSPSPKFWWILYLPSQVPASPQGQSVVCLRIFPLLSS